MFGRINKNYISPIHRFMKAFDKRNPKRSDSQKKEIEKAKRIMDARDHHVDENA